MPGVYCTTPGTLVISPNVVLTLDARNNTAAQWIFQAATTLMTGTRSSIVLKNGAQAANVFWAIGTSTTLGDASLFVGQMLTQTSATVGKNVLVGGRVLALTTVAFQSGSLVDTSYIPVAVNMSLGNSTKFAVLAGTSLTFGSGNTSIASGSVGSSPGTSITGTYQLSSGTTEINSASAGSAVYDLGIAYNLASTASCQYMLSSSVLSGLTLIPVVYCSSSGSFTIAQQASLTLDGLNGTNPVWIFQTTTSLTTGDFSSTIFKNKALPENVYWAVGSSASIGYAAFFAGNLIAQSSIAYASYAILNGRGLSFAAVSFAGYSSVSLPNGTATTSVQSVHINLGGCLNFGILAGTTLTFNAALTVVVSGSIGSSGGGIVSGNYQLSSGTTQSATAATIQCKNDLVDAYRAASTATCGTTLSTVYLTERVLTSGIYCSGTMELQSFGTLVLDAQNKTDEVWIFQVGTTLVTGISSKVILKNGAKASNIFWAVGTAATTGTSSFFAGQILTQTVVTLGAQSTLRGRALAKTSFAATSGALVSFFFFFFIL
jgi:hypothetical protein